MLTYKVYWVSEFANEEGVETVYLSTAPNLAPLEERAEAIALSRVNRRNWLKYPIDTLRVAAVAACVDGRATQPL